MFTTLPPGNSSRRCSLSGSSWRWSSSTTRMYGVIIFASLVWGSPEWKVEDHPGPVLIRLDGQSASHRTQQIVDDPEPESGPFSGRAPSFRPPPVPFEAALNVLWPDGQAGV